MLNRTLRGLDELSLDSFNGSDILNDIYLEQDWFRSYLKYLDTGKVEIERSGESPAPTSLKDVFIWPNTRPEAEKFWFGHV